MSWIDILKQRPFTQEELDFHGGQRNAEQVRRAKEAELAEQYRTQVQGQQKMPGYKKDQKDTPTYPTLNNPDYDKTFDGKTLTAAAPKPKALARARKQKYLDRETYARHRQQEAPEQLKRLKEVKELTDKVANAKTDEDRQAAQLELDRYNKRTYGGTPLDPRRGTLQQVRNTKKLDKLTDEANILTARLQTTSPGSTDHKRLTEEIKTKQKEMQELESNPDGLAQEYQRDLSRIFPGGYDPRQIAQTPKFTGTDAQGKPDPNVVSPRQKFTGPKPVTGAGTVQPTLQQTFENLPDRVQGDPNQKRLFTKDPRTGDYTFSLFGKSWKDELRR